MRTGPKTVKCCSTLVALGLLLSSTQAFGGGRTGPRRCLQVLAYTLALFGSVQGVGGEVTNPAQPLPPFHPDRHAWPGAAGAVATCAAPMPPPALAAPSAAAAALGFEGAIPAKRITLFNPYADSWILTVDAFPMDVDLQINQEDPMELRQGDPWHGAVPPRSSLTIWMTNPQEPGGVVIFNDLTDPKLRQQWEVALGERD